MGQVILPVSKHSENAQGNKTFFADLVHWQGILELERVSAISLTYDRLAVLMLGVTIDPPKESYEEFLVHRGLLKNRTSSSSAIKGTPNHPIWASSDYRLPKKSCAQGIEQQAIHSPTYQTSSS
jgi:hypothetical protein